MRFVTVWFWFCFCALSVSAQSDRATITGTISDPTGALVSAIEAKNTETGAVYAVANSETGNYTIAQLPADRYELTLTLPEFKKYVRSETIVVSSCHRSFQFDAFVHAWR